MILPVGRSVIYIGLVSLMCFSFVFYPKPALYGFSDTSDFVSVSYSDSLHLTQDKVKDWIEVRISIAKLQNQMKENAADFDNVVQSFFAKRESLLKSRGWTVQEFDAAKKRIHAGITAMDMEDELKASRRDHEKEIAKIEANEFFSEEQKEEMIKGLGSIRNQKQAMYIDPIQSDLPAIRPYRNTLQHMISWIAGNTENPPELD